jgi:hypothetical protein
MSTTMIPSNPYQFSAVFADGRVTPVVGWGEYSLHGGAFPLVFDQSKQGLEDARKMEGFLHIECRDDYSVGATRARKFQRRDRRVVRAV